MHSFLILLPDCDNNCIYIYIYIYIYVCICKQPCIMCVHSPFVTVTVCKTESTPSILSVIVGL